MRKSYFTDMLTRTTGVIVLNFGMPGDIGDNLRNLEF